MANSERINEKKPGSVIKKKVTSKDIEIWEVAGLSSNFEPCSKPSDLFEKLEEKRKRRHDEVLKKLFDALNEINEKTETNIRLSSAEFKAHAKHFQDELEDILKDVDKPEILSCDPAHFARIQKKVKEYKEEQRTLVNEMYADLNKYEDERAVENEKLLRVACEDIRKVGYLLPYQVQTFAEEETMKLNKLSLNNRRCYTDLKLSLTLLTEEMFKSFYDKFLCVQEKWIQDKAQDAYANIQNESERKVASDASSICVRLELRGYELPVQPSVDEVYSVCTVNEWAENVLKVANIIETHGRFLLDLHKKTQMAVYESFDKEVHKMKEELCAFDELELRERVIKPILFAAESSQLKEMEKLEVIWQDGLTEINRILKDVREFLQDVGKLWNHHNERLCESKKLILKAIEKDDENNEIVIQDLEVKLNLALDALRQEHVSSKMEKAHEAVIVILKSMKEKYESVYLNQVATVEDYYKMMDFEVDVLSAEIKEFIYVTHVVENEKAFPRFCEPYNNIPKGQFICQEIHKCCQHIRVLKTWKFGIWTALQSFSEKTKECLAPKTETWIQSRIENLAERMTTQLEILEKRFGRIKTEIYQKRLSEIEFHQEVFESHQEGVRLAFRKMRTDLETLIGNVMETLNSERKAFTEIVDNVRLECRPGVIKTKQITVERKRREFENKLSSLFVTFRADCEVKAANITQANIAYMKSIRLFHEGGDYSAEEAKSFIAQLEIIDKEIATEIKGLVKDATKEENELMKKSSAAFLSAVSLLINLYEETYFKYETTERIREFRENIENLVNDLRSNFDQLQSQTECLCAFVSNRREKLREDDCRFWWSLLTLLYKNVSNLFYPMKFSLMPAESENAYADHLAENDDEEDEDATAGAVKFPCCFGNNKFSTKATISQTPTFRSTEVTDNFSCHPNYVWELFKAEDPPQNDGTFMAVVSNYLWSELDSLQKMACSFYKRVQGRKIIRSDLIQTTYELFATETVPKFRSCKVQCEQVWLHTIVEFLPVVSRIKAAANCYFRRQLDDYENFVTSSLNEYEKAFLTTLNHQNVENAQIYKSLDDKLLPLHGNPSNKHLLDQLEEEVVQSTSGLGALWDSAIKKHKNQLTCFRIHHIKEQNEIQKMEAEYLKLKDKVFIEDLGNNILDTILEHAEKDGNGTARSDKDRTVAEKVHEDAKLNLKCDLGGTLRTVPSYLALLLDSVKMERAESEAVGNTSSAVSTTESSGFGSETGSRSGSSPRGPCRSVCNEKYQILASPFDFPSNAVALSDRINRRLAKMQNFADSKMDVHEKSLFEWLNVWKYNVKKVKKLFTVKYEEKPVQEEKSSQNIGKLIQLYLCSYITSTKVDL